MKIVLATGIYPPEIGGPATYVRRLAEELTQRGEKVTVITYGEPALDDSDQPWTIIRVPSHGGSLLRWRRYAKVLKNHAADADVVECFSSVSAGVPLRMAGLRQPKKILRLGGDFTWERYTDMGRRRTLRGFITQHPRLRLPMEQLLGIFDHIIFSTRFQEELYEHTYKRLPAHSVIENALPDGEGTVVHQKHDPMRLLYFGRFVKFKNLENLLRAVAGIPLATLTFVGSGPVGPALSALARSLMLQGRVTVLPPMHGEASQRIFAEHDLLIIPSLTEISPNAALEARAAGLPVLLTEENGLSDELRSGMIIRPLTGVNDITKAILEADHQYDSLAAAAAAPLPRKRGWEHVAEEHLQLFQSLPVHA